MIAIAIPSLIRHFDREETDSALDERGSGGGAGGPLVPGEPLSFGLVTTRNVSGDPVQLVSARLLWLDPGLKLLGFTANPKTAGAPLTAREWPVSNGVPLDEFPPLTPSANNDQVAILFGLTVEPGREGKALGVAVRYRQNGKLKEQLFKVQAFVCAVPALDPKGNCPGHASDFDVAKDFDEELKARRRKGGSPAGS
ncbi:MAG: hypothetical protein ACRDYF_16585 [Acidimicrobiia bacterium]